MYYIDGKRIERSALGNDQALVHWANRRRAARRANAAIAALSVLIVAALAALTLIG